MPTGRPLVDAAGHVERGARVVDVSANGDWSAVRVWYAPMKGLGTSTYPLNGFIYNGQPATELKPEILIALR